MFSSFNSNAFVGILCAWIFFFMFSRPFIGETAVFFVKIIMKIGVLKAMALITIAGLLPWVIVGCFFTLETLCVFVFATIVEKIMAKTSRDVIHEKLTYFLTESN